MAGITINLVPSGIGAFNLPNAPGEDFRTTLARTPSRSSSPLNTEIKIVEVHHGRLTHQQESWDPKINERIVEDNVSEATLLLFHIHFQSRLQDRRYKSVLVRFEFLDKTGDERRHHEVYKFAPARTHWLRKTTYNKTTTYGASLKASSGGGPAGGEAGVHWQTETAKTVNSKAVIVGKSTLSAGKERDGANAVEWSMEENKGESDGVPTFLQAAVLLKRNHSKHFYVRLHVSSEVDSFSKSLDRNPLLSFRSSDKDPIIDDVCLKSGQLQMQNLNTTGIKLSDLQRMERLEIDQHWQVNQSEEDTLVSNGRSGEEETRERNAQALDDVATVPPSPPFLAEHVSSDANVNKPPLAEGHTPLAPPLPLLPVNATMAAAEAVAKAAEAAAKAAEAAAKAAEAASHAAGALIKLLQAAVVAEERRWERTRQGISNL
ncbi:hypothetical protein S40288_09924 [Stachybotrys chartarum IBT 40288]|nr:hypothetical protein S40288_09924 [Stachybotrys chartarum IBT 40288]